MTGLPDNNGNDFIRGLETRACVNGMTKSDVERLKNALVKKILDDETVIDVTDDGSIIADSNGMFISVNGQVLGLSVDGEDIIPVTEPYLPEDGNENPLAPPNDTIMTSANIAVDPRIVRTTGNQTISGIKTFSNVIRAWNAIECFNVGRKGYVYPDDATTRYEISRTNANIWDYYAEVTIQTTSTDSFSALICLGESNISIHAINYVGSTIITIGACIDPDNGQRIIWFKSNGRNNHMAKVQAYTRFGVSLSINMNTNITKYIPSSQPTIENSVTGGS